jgi:hypothetical protein
MRMQPDLKFLPAVAIRGGTWWTQHQRARYRNFGRPLTRVETDVLSAFIPATTLSGIRVANAAQIKNPPFFKNLSVLGIAPSKLLDLARASGITFVDTILIKGAKPPSLSLLFHEAVHVLQFQELGVDGFVRRYVSGWVANGFKYSSIPLERDAYDLQARFDKAPNAPFDVLESVRKRLSGQD